MKTPLGRFQLGCHAHVQKECYLRSHGFAAVRHAETGPATVCLHSGSQQGSPSTTFSEPSHSPAAARSWAAPTPSTLICLFSHAVCRVFHVAESPHTTMAQAASQDLFKAEPPTGCRACTASSNLCMISSCVARRLFISASSAVKALALASDRAFTFSSKAFTYGQQYSTKQHLKEQRLQSSGVGVTKAHLQASTQPQTAKSVCLVWL